MHSATQGRACPRAPSATGLARDIRSGRLDPREAVERALSRIAECDDEVGAFVRLDAQRARDEAADRADQIRRGEPIGPLHGVPVAVKDAFDVAGQPTTAGSMVPPGPPATVDATAVARLRRAGAVVLGRTRMHEFAWGVTGQHPRLGGTRNPWDLARVPGGSSGGSAAAVAAGMTPLALGTDTACSIRLPAAWCGVVGHKPTYGAVPRAGVIPLAPSFDHVGALVRDPVDARLALSVLADAELAPPADVRGLTVGAVEAGDRPEPTATIATVLRRATDRLADLGAEPRPTHIPMAGRLQETYRTLQAVEALAWHRDTGRWPTHAAAYTTEIRNRLLFCEQVTPDEVAASEGVLAELKRRTAALFERVDVLLMPVAAGGPPLIRDVAADGTDVASDPGAQVLPWTLLASLCGLPACSVSAGHDDDGMPVGAQVVGRPGADARVLDVAAALTAAL